MTWARLWFFCPLGGLTTLRETTIQALQINPGDTVLELGCGTGGLTAMLSHKGATVTAVDRSEAMLRVARRRAPQASFVLGDIITREDKHRYDRVLLAFVLHHMQAKERLITLDFAHGALKPGGLVGILDWAQPDRWALRCAQRMLIAAIEPPSALEWLDQGFEAQIAQSSLSPVASHRLAGGAAKVVVARSLVSGST